jgi:hypothetical protein
MFRGIALGTGIVVRLVACATPGTQNAVHPPAAFEHRVSAADVRVFWNCTQPEQGVLQMDGVVQNIGGQQIQFAEVEVVAVNASNQTVSSARSAVRDIRLQSNQSSPLQLQLRTLGDEVRFDMFYRHRVGSVSGIGADGPRQVQNMARDVCSPTPRARLAIENA